jgi:pilus assembly protein CpaE
MFACIVQTETADQKTAVITKVLKKLGCDIIVVNSIEAAAYHPQILAATASIIVVPESSEPSSDVGHIVKYAHQLAGRAFVLYIADRISPEDYKALLRLGDADSTDWKSAVEEVGHIVRRLGEEGASPAREPSPAASRRVIAFVGTRGGPGNTTIAMECGIYLASLKGKDSCRVALLDLEFAQSLVCDYLDIMPRLDISAIAGNPERLDEYMLTNMASRHSSGLDVFASRQPWFEQGETLHVAVFLLLNRLLDRYDIVLIDIPAHRLEETDEILQKSDFIFVTGLFSVPAVKQIHRAMQRFAGQDIPLARTAAIITDTETKIFGLVNQRFNIKDIIGEERLFFVRRDRSFSMECVDAGNSMIQSQPSRAICDDIKKIAEHIKTVAPIESA